MSETTTALAETSQQTRALGIWGRDDTREKIKALIPASMSFDRFNRLTTSLILRNPKIAECEPVSLFSVISDCATIGVYPDPVTGLAYVIPRYNKRKGCSEATLIVGYKGLRAIALRSPEILDLWTGVVREGDEFTLRRAPRQELIHNEDPKQLGDVIGYYSVAALKNGLTSYEWMPATKVHEIRDAALKGLEDWKIQSSPWTNHFDEMARKTVLRRHFKSLPLRVEDQEAIAQEMDRDESGLKFAEKVDESGQPVPPAVPPRPPRPERKSGIKAAIAEEKPAEPVQEPKVVDAEVVDETPAAAEKVSPVTPQPAPANAEKMGAPADVGTGNEQDRAATPPPAGAPAKPAPVKPKPSAPTWPMDTIGNVTARKPGRTKAGAALAVLTVNTEHYSGTAYSADVDNPLLMDGLTRDANSPDAEPTFSGKSKTLFLKMENRGSADKPLILVTAVTDKMPEVI